MLIPMLSVQSWNMIGLALLHIAIALNVQKIIAGKILDFKIQNFCRAAGPLIYENHIIARWLAT